MPTDFAAATASMDRVIESCFRGDFFQASFWPKLVKHIHNTGYNWYSTSSLYDITAHTRNSEFWSETACLPTNTSRIFEARLWPRDQQLCEQNRSVAVWLTKLAQPVNQCLTAAIKMLKTGMAVIVKTSGLSTTCLSKCTNGGCEAQTIQVLLETSLKHSRNTRKFHISAG